MHMLNYSDEFSSKLYQIKCSRVTHGRGLINKVSDMNKDEIERNEYY